MQRADTASIINSDILSIPLIPMDDLICCDCGAPFEFTDGERDFYALKGLLPPKRCKACRMKRKTAGIGPRTLHEHICAECGKTCKLPFPVKPDRKALCRECFSMRR